MRRSHVFLLVSASVLCSALAFPTQEQKPPLAEEQFKNIKSFKGVPASEIIPAMEFMSASLKVDCMYCHTEDYARDTKEEKRTTREMVAMQNEINEKHFGGRPEVTCATCHSGRPQPLAFSPAMGLDDKPKRDRTIMPEKVLEAYGKAVGGDASALIAGMRVEGSTVNRGVKGTVATVRAGEKFRVETNGKPLFGFNGTMGWYVAPNGVNNFPKEYAQPLIDEQSIFFGPKTLPKLEVSAGATATIRGRENLVVYGPVAGNEKSRVTYFFDKQTGLLSRVTFYHLTVLGSIARINDYSNYKKVNGVQFPMTIENHSADKDLVLTVKSVKADAKVDPKLFEPPK